MNKADVKALKSERRKVSSIHDDLSKFAMTLEKYEGTDGAIHSVLNARSCLKKARMQIDDILPFEPMIIPLDSDRS